MASTSGHSDCELHRIIAREEHYERARPSSPHLHRGVNSAELECMGCQFHSPYNQTSWERVTELDIPEESISYRRTLSIEPPVEIVRVARQQPSLLDSSRGGPQSTPTSASVMISYPMSQEQFHLFIQQRSVIKQEDTSAHRSEGSIGSDHQASPAMSEDHEISGEIPPAGSATPTVSSSPRTPPPQSVATTEDGHHDAGKGPVSPRPWTTYEGRWHQLVDGKAE